MKVMQYNYSVAVFKFATEVNYPSTGAVDALYVNEVNDVVKFWDNTVGIYRIYVGPRPHK